MKKKGLFGNAEGAKDTLLAFWGSVVISALIVLIGIFILAFNPKLHDTMDLYGTIIVSIGIIAVIVTTFISARNAYKSYGISTSIRGLFYVATSGGFVGLMIAWAVGLLVKYPYVPGIGFVLIIAFFISFFGRFF